MSARAILVTLSILAPSAAGSATLNISGGVLLGAYNVDVNGVLFAVEFTNGSCVTLYDSCDEASDLAFDNEAEALAASQALLAQVFLDTELGGFDTDTTLTNGCSSAVECSTLTPYNIRSATALDSAVATNQPIEANDGVHYTLHAPFAATSGDATRTFAIWTVVPEPSTALLLAAGLVGLCGRGHLRPR